MSDEWGPWIEHNGQTKPSGFFVEREYANGLILSGFVGSAAPLTNRDLGLPLHTGETFSCSWMWGRGIPGRSVPVISYRVRKPRGLATLESLLADLPKQVDA